MLQVLFGFYTLMVTVFLKCDKVLVRLSYVITFETPVILVIWNAFVWSADASGFWGNIGTYLALSPMVLVVYGAGGILIYVVRRLVYESHWYYLKHEKPVI